MGRPLKQKKKRKADRIRDDHDGESNLPVRSTKEIVETHSNMPDRLDMYVRDATTQLGVNENGRESFEDVLRLMASPDTE